MFFSSVYSMTKSDFSEPLNLGSDEMVSMNEMAEMILGFSDKKLPIKHIPGPEGVRGRNSDNTLIKEKLGWAPVCLPNYRMRISELQPYPSAHTRHGMVAALTFLSRLTLPSPRGEESSVLRGSFT